MILEGYYINLDRSLERRAHMEQQIQNLQLDTWIQRFDAIDGRKQAPETNREIASIQGCFLSHRMLIEQSNPESLLLVLEDDVDFSPSLPAILTADVLTHFVNSQPEVDIIFLDCLAYLNSMQLLQDAAQAYMPYGKAALEKSTTERRGVPTVNIIDAHQNYAVAAAAYIVTPHGKQRLKPAFAQLPSTHAVAIDHFYAGLIQSGQLHARIFLPYLATPSVSLSQVSTLTDDARHHWSEPPEIVAGHLALRRLLFAGDCHAQELRAMVTPLLEQYGPTPERLLALEIIDAVNNWRKTRQS